MSSDIQPGLLRKMTVRSIFEKLQQSGPLSRADLTRETGISAPTVSKVVSELIEQGLVEETSFAENLLGRPGKRLCVARTRSRLLGIAVCATETILTPASLDGQIDVHLCHRFPTPESYEEWLTLLTDYIRTSFLLPQQSLLGLGVCIPGLIDRRSQKVLVAPSISFLQDAAVAADLTARTGVRSVVAPQGQALAVAERLFGTARWLSDFVVLDASDGPAVGVYSDGELISGKNGLAGPFNIQRTDRNTSGGRNNGILATDQMFIESISERMGTPLNLDQIWQQVQSRQLNIEQELDQICETLAASAAAAINLFNPATLYIHSRILGFDQSLISRLKASAEVLSLKYTFEGCEIRAASVTPQDAAIAAIIDELTQSLGPRLNHHHPVRAPFAQKNPMRSGLDSTLESV